MTTRAAMPALERKMSAVEREVRDAYRHVGPLHPEERDGFVTLDLRLPQGHGLCRLEVAALTYVASVDRYHVGGGCRASLEHMGRLTSFVRAYRADLAEQAHRRAKRTKTKHVDPLPVVEVPKRRLRSMFERLSPPDGSGWLTTITHRQMRADGGTWETWTERRVAGVDVTKIDPNKPVSVPMPAGAAKGRGGRRWSPSAAGMSRAKGRWSRPASASPAPSKPAPVTIKAGSGETPGNEGRAPSKPAIYLSSFSESRTVSDSSSKNHALRAPKNSEVANTSASDIESKIANRQSPDLFCLVCLEDHDPDGECPHETHGSWSAPTSATVVPPTSSEAAAPAVARRDPESATSSAPTSTTPATSARAIAASCNHRGSSHSGAQIWRSSATPPTSRSSRSSAVDPARCALPPTERHESDGRAVERNRPALLVSGPRSGPPSRQPSDASQGRLRRSRFRPR